MDITTLVNLTSRAWCLSILAALNAGTPGRQAPLLAATQASRTSFRASLDHLIDIGLLERNPGHGHPLRPEFRLTPAGAEAAQMARKIIKAVPNADEFALLRKSWSVPVLALTQTPQRFSIMKTKLHRVTDRALSASLLQLEEGELIQRDINLSERRPYPTYCAINAGREVSHAVGLNF
ncbi:MULTISPECIES: winged helix-turn-helix transcriptional regulator [unclassified Ruegeria]|uniref:winged helix-turn-helix transcriptional regulator n=1 Tax=unclassified Ruegeria TaxID=2625375 RepID=UPI00148872E4|nr:MULTISPECIES: winged helix-turn-helix transcriptional regulator [unclassified Ruegeria]